MDNQHTLAAAAGERERDGERRPVTCGDLLLSDDCADSELRRSGLPLLSSLQM